MKKSIKIVFLYYPCRVVVCESADSPNAIDPSLNDLREYARIIPRTAETGGVWVTRFDFAGQIEWSEHAAILTDEHRRLIEAHAAKLAEADKERTAKAKALQAYQRAKYATQAAKYGE